MFGALIFGSSFLPQQRARTLFTVARRTRDTTTEDNVALDAYYLAVLDTIKDS